MQTQWRTVVRRSALGAVLLLGVGLLGSPQWFDRYGSWIAMMIVACALVFFAVVLTDEDDEEED